MISLRYLFVVWLVKLISALALAVVSGVPPLGHEAFHPPGREPLGSYPAGSTARPGRRPHTAHPAIRRPSGGAQLTRTFDCTNFNSKTVPKTLVGWEGLLQLHALLKSLVELTNLRGSPDM